MIYLRLFNLPSMALIYPRARNSLIDSLSFIFRFYRSDRRSWSHAFSFWTRSAPKIRILLASQTSRALIHLATWNKISSRRD
ncbi:hypothetical protein Hanom_Chr16g01499321 [Helianthus anomalus]